jgi:hypothetical protein
VYMPILKVARLHDQIVRVNLVSLTEKCHGAAISRQGMLLRESRK